jgi:hypothetical protein
MKRQKVAVEQSLMMFRVVRLSDAGLFNPSSNHSVHTYFVGVSGVQASL